MVLGSDLRRGTGRGLAVAVLVLACALTACGDDSGGDETTPPSPSVKLPRTTEPTPSASAPDDPAEAERQIKENWKKFFDPDVPTKDKQAVLENGDKMDQVLKSFSGDERGGQVEATVTEVEFTSPAEANVTYTLTLKGATVMPDAAGTAVEQDDTWKVSVKTLCGLVGLSGNESPGPGC
ncbi:hypothetical protein O1Q96_12910 [Streptomyces sp. Qhu-G9]|uniref:hypothetical protein n=1 Tax=Streptomyces sp. Qhu-G9 TaxID=3452799 RepID=UPI0022AC47C3|nr:hypothetical protein [Streptomyces aurantiacus]WAU80583.1 hypothetical protein O1Q96_12910 [Streptomyces aurantiacus]